MAPPTNNDAFDALCKLIAAKGVLLPIFVHPDTLEIVSGHYRYLAAKVVGKNQVPVCWVKTLKQVMETMMAV